MTKKEQPPPSLPKLVKLDNALKLAEQWVNNMSRSFEEESAEVEIEGRPARLGLGAKELAKSKRGDTNDPVERKLHAKLDPRKRKAMGAEASIASLNAFSDDDDHDLESRTNVFSKKRAFP
ncbi:hypothetical protein Ancab_023996 [Ancistrocladus abbreviatus]